MNAKQTRIFQLLFLVVFATGCASSYRTINPPLTNFYNSSVQDSVKFAYRYDALWDCNNKKYAKKEPKNNVRLVILRIDNESQHTINFKDEVMIYAGGSLAIPIDNLQLYRTLKQSAPAYMVYLLLTPVHLFSVNMGGSSDVFPFGYILGPGLCIINMIKVTSANSKFKYEVLKYNILDKAIKPGEIAYGIIGIETEDSPDLTFKLIQKNK